MPGAREIEAARERLSGHVHVTPLLHSRLIDERAGGPVLFKMESLQRSGAFKFRGACHALLCNLERARERGVVTGSSGNHGGALALAAASLGVRATVVMPENATGVKVAAIRDTGAEVIFCGRTNAERLARASELERERGLLFLPPYDHPDVLAGQGTVALEVLAETDAPDLFVVPCGGGGLLAGCAAVLAEQAPGCEVWGVEPEACDDMLRSLDSGQRLTTPLGATICDGARNTSPGELTFPIIRDCCAGVVLVPDAAVREAMQLCFSRMKQVVEPTGALAAAALLSGALPLKGRAAVAVVTGGNVDPALFARCIAEG